MHPSTTDSANLPLFCPGATGYNNMYTCTIHYSPYRSVNYCYTQYQQLLYYYYYICIIIIDLFTYYYYCGCVCVCESNTGLIPTPIVQYAIEMSHRKGYHLPIIVNRQECIMRNKIYFSSQNLHIPRPHQKFNLHLSLIDNNMFGQVRSNRIIVLFYDKTITLYTQTFAVIIIILFFY